MSSIRDVDAVITDPPYAIPTHVAAGRESVKNVGDLSIVERTFSLFFDELGRVIKPSGRAFVFCDGNSYPVIYRASYGKFSQALLVWDKGRIGMGREFRKQHELIMHLWRGDTPVFSDGRGRPDILRAAPVGNARIHEAEKPVALLGQLVELCGPLILDPFMGSGSTGEAALTNGRRFIGVEISEPYYDKAAARLARIESEVSSRLLDVAKIPLYFTAPPP
jgi:site-specific DNA-methyltransferase (adenine-specific)